MAGEPGNWLTTRLRPAETAVAAMVAVLWMSLVGMVIASCRMIDLVVAAYRVSLVALTAVLYTIGSATCRYWFLLIPLWAAIFLASMLWALAIPEKRQGRLAGLLFGLSLCSFMVVIATYLPFAQAAASIARPLGVR